VKNPIKIAFIGECMLELSGEPFSAMRQSFGGDTVNTAIYLRKLLPSDSTVSFVSVIGADALNRELRERLDGYSIDTQFVLEDEVRNCGLYLISNREDGERDFQYWRGQSAARFMMRHHAIERVFSLLSGYNAVFLSGISLAILPAKDRDNLLNRLAQLSAAGITIAFDGNFRPLLWPDRSAAQKTFETMYRLSDLVFVTLDDEQDLWLDADIDVCARRLESYGIPELVIKNGADGCRYSSGGCVVNTPAIEGIQVRDTTAAGDSFNAGFLAAWIDQRSPHECNRIGNALASQVIQRVGAIVDVDLSSIGI